MQSSILFSEEELKCLEEGGKSLQTPLNHPYEYFKVKTGFLDQLTHQIENEKNFMGIDNPYLRNLMSDYSQRQKVLGYKIIEEERYVPPNQFDTILGDADKEEKNKQKVFLKDHSLKLIMKPKAEELREKYYQECIVEPNKKPSEDEYEDPELMLTMPYHKRVLNYEKFKKKNKKVRKMQEKYLGEDITSLFEKTEEMLKKTSVSKTCKNVKIIKKMAPILLNAYEIYFDEIYDALLDDLLEEEVVFLNKLEEFNSKNKEIINKARDSCSENPEDCLPILPSQLNVLLEKLEAYIDTD